MAPKGQPVSQSMGEELHNPEEALRAGVKPGQRAGIARGIADADREAYGPLAKEDTRARARKLWPWITAGVRLFWPDAEGNWHKGVVIRRGLVHTRISDERGNDFKIDNRLLVPDRGEGAPKTPPPEVQAAS